MLSNCVAFLTIGYQMRTYSISACGSGPQILAYCGFEHQDNCFVLSEQVGTSELDARKFEISLALSNLPPEITLKSSVEMQESSKISRKVVSSLPKKLKNDVIVDPAETLKYRQERGRRLQLEKLSRTQQTIVNNLQKKIDEMREENARTYSKRFEFEIADKVYETNLPSVTGVLSSERWISSSSQLLLVSGTNPGDLTLPLSASVLSSLAKGMLLCIGGGMTMEICKIVSVAGCVTIDRGLLYAHSVNSPVVIFKKVTTEILLSIEKMIIQEFISEFCVSLLLDGVFQKIASIPRRSLHHAKKVEYNKAVTSFHFGSSALCSDASGVKNFQDDCRVRARDSSLLIEPSLHKFRVCEMFIASAQERNYLECNLITLIQLSEISRDGKNLLENLMTIAGAKSEVALLKITGLSMDWETFLTWLFPAQSNHSTPEIASPVELPTCCLWMIFSIARESREVCFFSYGLIHGIFQWLDGIVDDSSLASVTSNGFHSDMTFQSFLIVRKSYLDVADKRVQPMLALQQRICSLKHYIATRHLIGNSVGLPVISSSLSEDRVKTSVSVRFVFQDPCGALLFGLLSNGELLCLEPASGKFIKSTRVMWSERYAVDVSECGQTFRNWLRSIKPILKKVEQTSSNLSWAHFELETKFGMDTVVVDPVTGMICMNCSFISRSVCFYDSTGDVRLRRIPLSCVSPNPAHIALIESIHNGTFSFDPPALKENHLSGAIKLMRLVVPKSLLIVTFFTSSAIHILDMFSGNPVTVLTGHKFPVRTLYYDLVQHLLLSSCKDNYLRVWEMNPRLSISKIKVKSSTGGFESVIVHESSHYLPRISFNTLSCAILQGLDVDMKHFQGYVTSIISDDKDNPKIEIVIDGLVSITLDTSGLQGILPRHLMTDQPWSNAKHDCLVGDKISLIRHTPTQVASKVSDAMKLSPSSLISGKAICDYLYQLPTVNCLVDFKMFQDLVLHGVDASVNLSIRNWAKLIFDMGFKNYASEFCILGHLSQICDISIVSSIIVSVDVEGLYLMHYMDDYGMSTRCCSLRLDGSITRLKIMDSYWKEQIASSQNAFSSERSQIADARMIDNDITYDGVKGFVYQLVDGSYHTMETKWFVDLFITLTFPLNLTICSLIHGKSLNVRDFAEITKIFFVVGKKGISLHDIATKIVLIGQRSALNWTSVKFEVVRRSDYGIFHKRPVRIMPNIYSRSTSSSKRGRLLKISNRSCLVELNMKKKFRMKMPHQFQIAYGNRTGWLGLFHLSASKGWTVSKLTRLSSGTSSEKFQQGGDIVRFFRRDNNHQAVKISALNFALSSLSISMIHQQSFIMLTEYIRVFDTNNFLDVSSVNTSLLVKVSLLVLTGSCFEPAVQVFDDGAADNFQIIDAKFRCPQCSGIFECGAVQMVLTQSYALRESRVSLLRSLCYIFFSSNSRRFSGLDFNSLSRDGSSENSSCPLFLNGQILELNIVPYLFSSKLYNTLIASCFLEEFPGTQQNIRLVKGNSFNIEQYLILLESVKGSGVVFQSCRKVNLGPSLPSPCLTFLVPTGYVSLMDLLATKNILMRTMNFGDIMKNFIIAMKHLHSHGVVCGSLDVSNLFVERNSNMVSIILPLDSRRIEDVAPSDLSRKIVHDRAKLLLILLRSMFNCYRIGDNVSRPGLRRHQNNIFWYLTSSSYFYFSRCKDLPHIAISDGIWNSLNIVEKSMVKYSFQTVAFMDDGCNDKMVVSPSIPNFVGAEFLHTWKSIAPFCPLMRCLTSIGIGSYKATHMLDHVNAICDVLQKFEEGVKFANVKCSRDSLTHLELISSGKFFSCLEETLLAVELWSIISGFHPSIQHRVAEKSNPLMVLFKRISTTCNMLTNIWKRSTNFMTKNNLTLHHAHTVVNQSLFSDVTSLIRNISTAGGSTRHRSIHKFVGAENLVGCPNECFQFPSFWSLSTSFYGSFVAVDLDNLQNSYFGDDGTGNKKWNMSENVLQRCLDLFPLAHECSVDDTTHSSYTEIKYRLTRSWKGITIAKNSASRKSATINFLNVIILSLSFCGNSEDLNSLQPIEDNLLRHKVQAVVDTCRESSAHSWFNSNDQSVRELLVRIFIGAVRLMCAVSLNLQHSVPFHEFREYFTSPPWISGLSRCFRNQQGILFEDMVKALEMISYCPVATRHWGRFKLLKLLATHDQSVHFRFGDGCASKTAAFILLGEGEGLNRRFVRLGHRVDDIYNQGLDVWSTGSLLEKTSHAISLNNLLKSLVPPFDLQFWGSSSGDNLLRIVITAVQQLTKFSVSFRSFERDSTKLRGIHDLMEYLIKFVEKFLFVMTEPILYMPSSFLLQILIALGGNCVKVLEEFEDYETYSQASFLHFQIMLKMNKLIIASVASSQDLYPIEYSACFRHIIKSMKNFRRFIVSNVFHGLSNKLFVSTINDFRFIGQTLSSLQKMSLIDIGVLSDGLHQLFDIAVNDRTTVVSSSIRSVCGSTPILYEAARLVIFFLMKLPFGSEIRDELMFSTTPSLINVVLNFDAIQKFSSREKEDVLNIRSNLIRHIFLWKIDTLRGHETHSDTLRLLLSCLEPIVGFLHLWECSSLLRLTMDNWKRAEVPSDKVADYIEMNVLATSKPSHFAEGIVFYHSQYCSLTLFRRFW